MHESLVQTLSRLEAELHHPLVRRDASRIGQLLHADFEEVGRSGCRYSREAVVAALRNENEECPANIMADLYVATDLGQGAALLTYRSALKQKNGSLTHHTLRSSIWIRIENEWRLCYHQGTAAAEVW